MATTTLRTTEAQAEDIRLYTVVDDTPPPLDPIIPITEIFLFAGEIPYVVPVITPLIPSTLQLRADSVANGDIQLYPIQDQTNGSEKLLSAVDIIVRPYDYFETGGAKTASIVEGTLATEESTVTGIFAVTQTEVGNAVESVNNGLRSTDGAITEAGNAVDTPNSSLIATAAITEQGNAIDIPDAPGASYHLAQVDNANAVDQIIDAITNRFATLTENGNAVEQVITAARLITSDIIEYGNAVDIQDAPGAIYHVSIGENTTALDIIEVVVLMYVLKYWNGSSFEKGRLSASIRARGGWVEPKLKTYHNGIWKDVDIEG
jgi:hypothetical protein